MKDGLGLDAEIRRRIVGIVGIITLIAGKRSESSGVALTGTLMILAAAILFILSLAVNP